MDEYITKAFDKVEDEWNFLFQDDKRSRLNWIHASLEKKMDCIHDKSSSVSSLRHT